MADPRRGSKVATLGVAAVLALAMVAGGLAVAATFRGDATDASGLVAATDTSAAKPAGVITYEITGQGLFLANGAGQTIGTTTVQHLHAEGHVASPVDFASSPDGTLTAAVVRDGAGVFLAVRTAGGVQRSLTQLAAGTGPQLVAGGKGHARAVDGVPLVVAWSPDGKFLAFGTVTGAPYSLGIMSFPASNQPQVEYREVSGGYVGELAWAPDGSKLAVSTYAMGRLSHSVLVAKPDDADFSAVPVLIDGCHVTWSPDSAYVAIHRDPGAETGAWVVSATDRADRWAITREVQAFPLTWREG